MSKIVANLNGGASDEYATFKALNEALTGQVFKGFDVVPNSTPNMTVKVNVGSARIPTGTAPSDYYYMVNHDTSGGESVTIPTAAASPRIDYIVAYINKSVTAVTSPVNNTNNVLVFADVAGTPAGSPVVPTTAQIQTAIGAANPYIILAQLAVAASATTITTPNITDLRAPIIGPSAMLGYAEITADVNTTGANAATGLSITINVPTGGRRVEIEMWCWRLLNTTANTVADLLMWDGAIGGTQIAWARVVSATASAADPAIMKSNKPLSAGIHTINVSLSNVGGGTATLGADPKAPAYLIARLG